MESLHGAEYSEFIDCQFVSALTNQTVNMAETIFDSFQDVIENTWILLEKPQIHKLNAKVCQLL
jgi:hypothetical protein